MSRSKLEIGAKVEVEVEVEFENDDGAGSGVEIKRSLGLIGRKGVFIFFFGWGGRMGDKVRL